MGASCGCNPATFNDDATGRMRLLAKDESLQSDIHVPYTQMTMLSPLELHPKLAEIATQWTQCTDCNAPHPKWAEITRGILICIKCSGIHRALGTDVSKIRSIEMDKWTQTMVHNMYESNIEFNAKWEYHVDKEYAKPTSKSSRAIRTKYISAKYIDTAFIYKPDIEPMPPIFDTQYTEMDSNSAGMIQYSGVIEIGDIAVDDLLKTDLFNEPDAYIIMRNCKGQSVKTSVVRNTCNPKWNEHLVLSVTENDRISIEIYDSNLISKDELLCTGVLDVAAQCTRDERLTVNICMNGCYKKKEHQPTFTCVVVYTQMTA
eukprot:88272_1